MATQNPYFDLLEQQEQQRQQQLSASIAATSTLTYGVDPEAAARARSTAGFLGVPPAVVEAMPQEAERQARVRMIDGDTAQAPVLRQRYTDADFMKLASDDSGALSAVEKAVRTLMTKERPRDRGIPSVLTPSQAEAELRDLMKRQPGLDVDTARMLVYKDATIADTVVGQARGPAPTFMNVLRGMFNPDVFRVSSAGASIAAADALGLDPTQPQRRYDVLQARIANQTPEFETATAQGLFGGGQSLVRNAPGIALSVLAGNPLPGLAMAGGDVAGDAYGKYRGRGATPGQAATGAALEGGVEVATELLPMSFLVNRLGKAGAGDFIKGLLAREVPGEQLATLAQDAVDTAIANPDKTWADYVAERPGAAYQTLLATVVQAGSMGAVHRVVQALAPERAAAARAEESAAQVEQLAKVMEASKLRGRDATEFSRFVAQIAEERGEAPAELYVDSQQLANVLNQSAMTLTELRALAPAVADQLEATRNVPGSDVRVPVAELAAAGPNITTALLDHLRDGPESMSRAEARQFIEQEGERIQREVEQTLTRQQEADAFKESRQAVQDDVLQQLKTAGRFSETANTAYAALWANFFATQAARTGVAPQELYQRFGPKIVAQTKATALLDQFVPIKPLRQALQKLAGGSEVQPMPWALSEAPSPEMEPAPLRQGPAYSGAPDNLMGMAKGKPGKAFGEQKYRHVQYVEVTTPDGAKHVDAIAGLNAAHAMERARRNWSSAEVAPLTEAEAVERDPTIADDVNAAMAAGALRQGDDKAEVTRGSFDPSSNTLALLAAADLSTFLHESGHFFLEVQADLAARIEGALREGAGVSDAERAIVDDMGRILEWFGIKGSPDQTPLQQWLEMSLDEKREFHEQWARGFERYLMEGEAPSLDLQQLFARFRAWLVQVYRTLTALNVELSQDVRDVMGRLLASDAAISEAQDARALGPLFRSPDAAGMTAEEYADYQANAERATADASAQLDARLMKDMRWLSRARDKALKTRQAEVDQLRREVRRDVSAEVMAEPVYQAWQFLTGKELRVEPGIQAAETIDPQRQSGKLRTSHLKETHPEQWRVLSERRMTSDTNGMDPDIVAELFEGFQSGDQMVRALALASPPQQVIDELTDQQMLERYGDIASPQALQRAADEAVHNELRARVIAQELKALAKANKVTASGDSLYRRETIDVMAQAARAYAEKVIARQKVKDLRPAQYAAAEARSAKLAEQSLGKSTQEAAMHKRNQLVNNFATKAAYEAQREVQEGREFFRKVLTGAQDKVSKTRDFDVVQAARAILAEYGVGTRGEAAQRYLEAVQRNDPAMYEILRDKVDNLTLNARPLNELTVEEFRGLREEIESLWHLAKRSRQMEVDGQLIDLESAKLPLVERMQAIGIPDRVPGEGRAVTDAERRVSRLRSAAAALRRVEGWVDAKDGSSGMGPFRRFVWQPIKEAADRYRSDKATYLKRYRDLLASVEFPVARVDAPELGYTFGFSRGGSGKAEILHALLHTGNESNKRKLLLGREWGQVLGTGDLDTRRWDAFVNRMVREGVLTRADFDFVQGVWDLLEEMKPLAQKAHRDVFGRYFDEITAEGFNIQFPDGSVHFRGGYVPAVMDPEVVKDAATRALQEDENATLAYAFPSTPKGFTKTRVEINRPLLLDLRYLAQHIDKVLLFSHLEQPIRDVRKVLVSKEVSEPLHRIDPAAYDGLLTPWMNRAARQTVETKVPGDNNLMRFFSKARSRAGMAAMFANVANTAQQITGFSIAAVKVRPGLLLDAAVQWVKAPRQVARAVAEASPYMASRMDNEVAAMNDAIEQILLNPSAYEKAQAWTVQHAYFMQSAVDNVVGPIVWTGAYNQALEAGHSDLDARRLADAVVRQTQGSTLPEDVARFETGNAFVRLFTQFAGYFNMQANLLGTEFSNIMHEQGLRRGMGRGLYVFMLGFMVPAMVSELIVQAFRGGPDDEDKDGSTLDDWLMSVLLMANIRAGLAMVPGVGQAANAAMNTFNSKPYDDRISTSPAIAMIESAVKAPHSVYKAVADDGNRRAAVRDLATLISMTTGLPASAVARPLGYLAGVSDDRIEPTGPLDAARGLVTGVPSPESKQ